MEYSVVLMASETPPEPSAPTVSEGQNGAFVGTVGFELAALPEPTPMSQSLGHTLWRYWEINDVEEEP